MKKMIFLNPPFSAEELYGDLAGGGSELPPLGIVILATLTRKNGYETKIIDAAALKLNYEATVKKILEESPDILGITSTTMTIYKAAKVAGMVKERNSNIKIVVGGPHITCCPEETMNLFPEFDVGVIGEGEITLIELLKYFENGLDLSSCKGIIFRNNNSIITTGRSEFIHNLDQIPFPAWDLLPDMVKYYQPAATSLNRSPATLLVTSRGCPGKCVFCDNSMFGNKCRGHSAEYIIGMIEHLQKNYGIKDIFFEDDNFFLFKKRNKELCRLIKEKKIDISFSLMGRVDMITPDVLLMLKDAGCWQIGYGCESGSQKILDTINKGITVEQIERALDMTRKAGIRIKGLFMIGNFGESKETIEETLRFIKRVPMDDFQVNCFTPLPGTPGAKLAHKYGKYDPDWRKANIALSENFIPDGLTREELSYYRKRAYRIFYLRPRIVFYYFLKMFKDKKMFLKILKGGVSLLKYVILGNVNISKHSYQRTK